MGHLRVTGVGKAYKRYSHKWGRLAEWLGMGPHHEPQWVLRDISFEVQPGEAVSIIGVNGAGKSTLLKIITGTTRPTAGSVEVQGRIAALLELGMGFHPDFTGRQNVYMAAQLTGLSPEQIAGRIAAIEAFADIGDYIDQPVRIYSSGMQVRLAFSVATAFRPDILIVDEALAVGDIYFQQKCFERIHDYVARGTSLLFVTHSMGTILELCSRALLLRHGKLVHDGLPKDVVDLYQAHLLLQLNKGPESLIVASGPADPAAPQCPKGSNPAPTLIPSLSEEPNDRVAVGSVTTKSVALVGVRLFDTAGQPVVAVVSDELVQLEVAYRMDRPLQDPHVGFKIRNAYGGVIFETNTYCMRCTLGPVDTGALLRARFAFRLILAPGEYTVTAGFANSGYGDGLFVEALNYTHEAVAFTVLPNNHAIRWTGIANLNPAFEFTVS